jgi:sugar phosphate isomerase/epimerase
LDFETALRQARAAGYLFVEPYVYSPLSVAINSHLLVSTISPYYHLDAGRVHPGPLSRLLGELGLSFSAMDAHTSLLLPQVGVPALRRAIDLAVELNCPLVISDEGPLPTDWMSLEQGFDVLCLSLESVVAYAQKRQVKFALEMHNALTTRPDYLRRILAQFGPGELGLNFDTGNSFLAGNDPVEHARQVAQRVVHVHLKDIPEWLLAERGRVTGARVGVAIGGGVVDLRGVVSALATAGYQGVLSVECGTLTQAKASLPTVRELVRDAVDGKQP